MSLSSHLPALQVVIPLASAPLALLIRQRHLTWAMMVIVSWLSLAISILLWLQVSDGSVISYAIGAWPPPWGIEHRVDSLRAERRLPDTVNTVLHDDWWFDLSAFF
jgi:multicomponent Na+:H+ antiporter subunit D